MSANPEEEYLRKRKTPERQDCLLHFNFSAVFVQLLLIVIRPVVFPAQESQKMHFMLSIKPAECSEQHWSAQGSEAHR